MEDENMEEAPAGGASQERPHWRKSDGGNWAICGPVEIMKPGATIEVFRRDDSSSTQLLSSSEDDFGQPFESRNEPGTMLRFANKFEEVKE